MVLDRKNMDKRLEKSHCRLPTARPWLTMRTSTLLFPVLSLAPSVFAWGALGHRTVAAVAQNYLSSATKTWVSNILGDTLVNVATWADDYRYTTAGAFSASYHYIDALDNPPTSCSVSYSRDCGNACIVSAM
jgi:hypothetical protein